MDPGSFFMDLMDRPMVHFSEASLVRGSCENDLDGLGMLFRLYTSQPVILLNCRGKARGNVASSIYFTIVLQYISMSVFRSSFG